MTTIDYKLGNTMVEAMNGGVRILTGIGERVGAIVGLVVGMISQPLRVRRGGSLRGSRNVGLKIKCLMQGWRVMAFS